MTERLALECTTEMTLSQPHAIRIKIILMTLKLVVKPVEVFHSKCNMYGTQSIQPVTRGYGDCYISGYTELAFGESC